MSNAESLVKRRGSPSSASEEPNPKRTEEACADSSLVTQLFNDKFIKGLACVLAFDENIVGMAEKLLRDAKSEHGFLDLHAWEKFTSLPFWQNIQYPTKMGPKQQHLHQQIQETKARISDDPSLKPLFAEKDHIRVVLVLLILFWSRDIDDGTGLWESVDFEDFDEEESPLGCCAYYKMSVDHLRKSLPCEDEKKMMKNLTDELIKDPNIVEIFLELLGKVCSVSPQGAQEHFCKVKEIWGNHKFIDHLLKFEYGLRPRVQENSNIRLSIFVRSLIKKDPLFEVISEYDDPDFRMRVALSILIGFWSNEDMIPLLVHTMGGDAFGEKEEQTGEGKEESPRDWMSNTPNIMEFFRDKSIWELADQLKEEPEAVSAIDSFLETLIRDDCLCSYKYHFGAASSFWNKPSIILKFNEAMKKDPKLVEVLTKYSKEAEALRVQERMIHIRKDLQFELRAIDSFDSHSKMRLALNILFGYWVDRDVTELFLSLRCVKNKTGTDLNLGEIATFYYYASCVTDVEGLKRWLANKYGEGSQKALRLAKQIEIFQKEKGIEARKRGYSDGPLIVQLVLNKSIILTFSLCWFGSNGQFFKEELLGEQMQLLWQ